jgi:hypothetical protein
LLTFFVTFAISSQTTNLNDTIDELILDTEQISYLSPNTTIDSNVIISGDLSVKNKNINNTLTSVETNTSGIFYDGTTKILTNAEASLNFNIKGETTMDKELTIQGTQIKNSIDNLKLNTTGITFDNNTNINQNTIIKGDNLLYVGDMNIKQEILNINDYVDNGIVHTTGLVLDTLDTKDSILRAGRYPQLVAGYMLAGGSQKYELPAPVLSSTSYFYYHLNDDDKWVVAPGYKFDLYQEINYAGLYQTIDNTEGNKPLWVKSAKPNALQSVKVFFLGVEVVGIDI